MTENDNQSIYLSINLFDTISLQEKTKTKKKTTELFKNLILEQKKESENDLYYAINNTV